ncbi:PAAR domain-containing protein [Glaciimonas sp. CA11.2]|uniref:PAAR domain-containing protein n=1 Tax=unclassified Glaciimonas TaxID=2644401 RepID=UPI002AB59A90|nr:MULTISPECIES: PAAR domain-containing protein [unclassified Glaciimonas]MDY7545712.1 PAAR domain-containing protein [Glaciimonas sp. CA11.2]MEB0011640.1 PAAR domain-containing protein [Glaciimonas sp. Cout2]MEB0081437.1 PAAR domain-containing protein [Glaciimonas sp. Gout2]MEB0164779.1 PAAR domain-containing protein [Glaciimonas sp. CA11.2]
MTRRYYIHEGDATTARGVVKEGLANDQWHGLTRSFEGDDVYCRTCRSTGTISCSGTRVPNLGSHGKEAALDGDLCNCRCRRKPRLIASQSISYTEGDATPSDEDFGNHHKNAALGNAGSAYDRHFVLLDSVTGLPVEGVAYGIQSESGQHHGSANDQGETVQAHSSAPHKVTLQYAVPTRFGVDKK